MLIYKKTITGGLLFLLFFYSFFIPIKTVMADFSATDVVVTTIFCGNEIIEDDESCDMTDLGGSNCILLGYDNGVLTCNGDCTFNETECNYVVVDGGGGGGGGTYTPPTNSVVVYIPDTSVILSGRAYPMSKVVILKDGQEVATTIAGPDANFSVVIPELSPGGYNFSIYGYDNSNERSALFSFNVSITEGASTSISGIFIAPTISVEKTSIVSGDNLVVFGQSTPNADITVLTHSDEEIFGHVKADNDGAYLYILDTSLLAQGAHITKTKALYENTASSYGRLISFNVMDSDEEDLDGKASLIQRADLNEDGGVNLVDFSILVYWVNREETFPEEVDLNEDGVINLVDFSIMAYAWQG